MSVVVLRAHIAHMFSGMLSISYLILSLCMWYTRVCMRRLQFLVEHVVIDALYG